MVTINFLSKIIEHTWNLMQKNHCLCECFEMSLLGFFQEGLDFLNMYLYFCYTLTLLCTGSVI